MRSLTLPLWNVYAFFVTYANLHGWEPPLTASDSPLPLGEKGTGGEGAGAERPSLPSDNPLDRWLLSELHLLIRQVSEALENYDVTGATRPLQSFVANLSKWYLRRSRRRFWKNGMGADQRAAYATLYQALVILSKLLAPAMPFLAETLYQNLVHAADEGAPESVHLADWPAYHPALVDPALQADMQLVMKLASLGHAARQQAGIKVRQPLAEIAYSVTSQDEGLTLERFAGLLADELNVKQVRLLGSAGEAVTYSLKPLPEQLGPKYKSLFPRLNLALAEVDPTQAARDLLAGKPIHVTVEGIRLEIQPAEVQVRAEPRRGLAVVTDGPYLAALNTRLAPGLLQEGLAREFVRRVQALRKQAAFQITDRIHIYLQASPALAQAIQAHRELILEETLGVELVDAGPPGKAIARSAVTHAEFDGQQVMIGLVLAS